MLWAWETPQDLRFLKSPDVGVAFLAAHLYIKGQHVSVRPRRQPLRVAPGVYRMAVVRIDCDPAAKPVFSRRVVDALLSIVRTMDVPALQVDFDARTSERQFYRQVLDELRPAVTFLSITALASWCHARTWMDRLPVDEVVPMAFGIHTKFDAAVCRKSLGIAAEDALVRPAGVQRMYVFQGNSWTEPQVRMVVGSL
jgi:hypothetical protein